MRLVTWGILAAWLALAQLPAQAASQRALVMLVNFPDAISNVAADEYRRFFNDAEYAAANASASVRTYLRTVSGGQADYEFTVTDWIVLPQPVAYYTALDPGGQPSDGPVALLRDAVAALDRQGFDFAPYDNDGDGRIDLLGLVHRGSDPAFGSGLAPTWSTVPNLMPSIAVDGVGVERAWMITESDPAFGTMTTLGGVVHEMVGHAICGLPDLYDWLPAAWAQMWGGHPFTPTGFDAFSRHRCGWARIVDAVAAREVRLLPADAGGEAVRLWIDPYRESEFFLLEYRRPNGIDAGLPGAGLLIWHVDLGAGQSEFIRLEQADGRDDLANTAGYGAADAGDPFPGSTGNTRFAAETTPGSQARDGSETGIRVENIRAEADGAAMLAALVPAGTLKGITLAYDETYPRFGWNWAPAVGNAVGERVAVRFTTSVAGRLVALRLQYWGAPFDAVGAPRYDIAVYRDFLSGNLLDGAPLRRAAGSLAVAAGAGDWYTVALDTPLDVTAGESFVVDLGWDAPMVAIDYPGRNDGRSYYRAPDAAAYAALSYDLRLRARIETTAHAAAEVPSYRARRLLLPRVDIAGAAFQATAAELLLAADGRWDLGAYVADPYVIDMDGARFSDGLVSVPRVLSPDEAAEYGEVAFRYDADGRFTLIGGARR